MTGVRGVEIFRREGNVNFVIAEFVRRRLFRAPRQLQFVMTVERIAEINDFEFVAAVNSADFVQVKRVTVKFYAPFQVKHV